VSRYHSFWLDRPSLIMRHVTLPLFAGASFVAIGLLLWNSWTPNSIDPEAEAGREASSQSVENLASDLHPVPSMDSRTKAPSGVSPSATGREGQLWVHVVNHEGWGMTGVRITLGEQGRELGQTDASGDLRVELEELEYLPTRLVLHALSPGFVKASAAASVDPEDADLLRATIQLQPAGVLYGKVLGPGGDPRPNVQVMLLDADSTGGIPGSKPIRTSRFQVSTDLAGGYSFTDLPLGVEWYVGSPGNSWSWTWVGPVPRGTGQQAPDIILSNLPGARAIRGVVRWPDGQGVDSAVVSFRPVSGGAPRYLTADSKGVFEADESVPAGEYELAAGPPERIAGIGPAKTLATAGEEVVLVLSDLPVVELEVVTQGGLPVIDFHWKLGEADARSWGGVRALSSGRVEDPLGKVLVTWVPETSVVEIRAPGFQTHREQIEPSTEPLASMRISLRGGFHLAGRLEKVPEDVSEVILSAISTESGANLDLEESWRQRGVRSRRVSAPWTFNIQVEGPGIYALRARADGITDTYRHGIEIGDPPGVRGLVVPLVAGSLVHGSVWCSPETSPSFYRVSIGRTLDSTHSEVSVGSDRRFALRDIPPGSWWLRVLGTDNTRVGAPYHLHLGEGATERVEFDLLRRPHLQIRGRIRLGGLAFEDGIPSRGRTSTINVKADWKARLLVDAGEGQQLEDIADVLGDGRFELASQQSGDVELRLTGDGGHRSRVEFTWSHLPPDDLESLDLDIDVGRVVLRSSELSPKELAGVALLWTSPRDPNLGATLHGRFASNGLLLFPNVPAGELTIAVPSVSDGPLTHVGELVVRPGEDVVFNLD